MSGACVEVVGLEGAAASENAWRDLSVRAIEANVFAEPAFVLNALRHFARTDRLRLLFVWGDESRERLIGAIVLEFPRISVGFGVARAWQSNQAGLAALMLDREATEQALGAIMDWLARERPKIVGLLLPTLDVAGPTVLAVRALCSRRSAQFHLFGQRGRASLAAAAKLARGFEGALPKKRLKEWSRQMRRLKERGEVAFRVASDGAAVEKFLALEAKGWKGAQHTALGADVGLAAFTRSTLASLAGEGKLAIQLLELDGVAIAIGVMLRAGDRAFYWKTAYEESYAEYSPGLQLTLELSRAQQRDPAIATTDSCAIEGHPMIERLWTARLALIDGIVALRPGPARGLRLWLAGETAKRRLRETAKRLINPLRGRKRS
ncbi:GNAT family N-acetyltransferase [Methylocapsa sp. S129]|uniref:GNAT family N-acetyltransferase n=1 Tax=Methylocapsa sp. S129 TaxID=1641869 RepID=UPI00131B4AA7|nr:GNAT family N-acetyltransferase [Methylocapsa sp. S129]